MYDCIVVGGGIVGLSVAKSLLDQHPGARVLILEKESSWAAHQTGHNSGVIHSGIYYQPGSLKATLAREGNRAMIEFCQQHHIDYDICGKVIVATDEQELHFMDNLFERGIQNQLQIRKISSEELRELEPHVNGLGAIHVPMTGIVNYKQVCEALVSCIIQQCGEARLNTKVEQIVEDPHVVHCETNHGSFQTRYLINCAGLHSDRVAKMTNVKIGIRIVPFRGEYYELKPQKRGLVKNLIYPVPNPDFPFLGVHFTRTIGGHVEAGPNAVLSLKREGYTKADLNLHDFSDMMCYSGFWRLALKYWKNGMAEMVRSMSKAAFVQSLQRLIPEIEADDLDPAPAGVRAQGLKPDGTLVDDFCIVHGKRTIHVCNAPSPAATASLKIGDYIVNQLNEAFQLKTVG